MCDGTDSPAPWRDGALSIASATQDTHTQERNALDKVWGGVDDRERLNSQALGNDRFETSGCITEQLRTGSATNVGVVDVTFHNVVTMT